MTLAYTSELTLEQYELLESLLTPPPSTGRPRSVSMKRVIQAILYVLVSGCAWYLLPHEYPPYSTVYYYFRKWRDDGSWKRIHDHLVEWVRVDANRYNSPTAASLDSQTVATAVMVQQAVGYDGGKKIKGRKRPILVDTLGLIVAVVVTAANADDRLGLVALLQRYFASGVTRLRKIWVDGGYEAQWLCDWVRGLKQTHKVDLEVVENTGKGFQVVKHRWKVERTFGWLGNDRRHSRDYEVLTVSSEAMIQISMIRLLLKRLA